MHVSPSIVPSVKISRTVLLAASIVELGIRRAKGPYTSAWFRQNTLNYFFFRGFDAFKIIISKVPGAGRYETFRKFRHVYNNVIDFKKIFSKMLDYFRNFRKLNPSKISY